MPQENDSYYLWLACRRLENAYRFTSDVLLALRKQLEANMPKVRYAGREAAPDLTIDPWPKPPCFPGQPCQRSIDDLREFNQLVTDYTVAVGARLDDLYSLAEDLEIENLVFIPSQLPVAPEGGKVGKPEAKVGRPKRAPVGSGGRK